MSVIMAKKNTIPARGALLAALIFCAGAVSALRAQPDAGPEDEVLLSTAVPQEPDYNDIVDESVLALAPHPQDMRISAPEGMPSFGKWMYTPFFKAADWLGLPYKGKTLYEPINVIIEDAYARSPEEASQRLIAAAAKAGFPSRWGHSTGYLAYVNGAFRKQLIGDKHHAFSDAKWNKANNHGRIFGQVFFRDKYWFFAAYSREDTALFRKIRHRYASFNAARDKFAWSMDDATVYKVSRFVPLGNAILGSDKETTGDHDGLAVLLEAVE